jgi:hypothetical protein
MPPRTDFLTQQRRQIDARLQQLRPAHEEYLTLIEAKQALEGVKSPSATPARRGPGRPPGSGRARRRTVTRAASANGRRTATRAASANGRRRPRRARARRRGGNTRADQALQLIKSNPGISVPQIADRMGIRQNYLYRVTAALQKSGSVKRKGQGFVAA